MKNSVLFKRSQSVPKHQTRRDTHIAGCHELPSELTHPCSCGNQSLLQASMSSIENDCTFGSIISRFQNDRQKSPRVTSFQIQILTATQSDPCMASLQRHLFRRIRSVCHVRKGSANYVIRICTDSPHLDITDSPHIDLTDRPNLDFHIHEVTENALALAYAQTNKRIHIHTQIHLPTRSDTVYTAGESRETSFEASKRSEA